MKNAQLHYVVIAVWKEEDFKMNFNKRDLSFFFNFNYNIKIA
jgi:hypothetical protein